MWSRRFSLPPPGVATHIVKDAVVFAELHPSGIPGGSTEVMDVEAVSAGAAAGGGEGEEEESDVEGSEASEDKEVENQGLGPTGSASKMASLAPPASGPSPVPGAGMADMVAAEPASGAPLTALGLALGDEAVSTRLAASWVVYPTDLHQTLADDLYARLYDDMEGAEERGTAGARNGVSLCSLPRCGRVFQRYGLLGEFGEVCPAERKMASGRLPGWLPPLLEMLATAVRERSLLFWSRLDVDVGHGHELGVSYSF